MRSIKGLSKETLKILNKIHQTSKYYQVRQRAHCMILSYRGTKISELMSIFQVSRNTIYNWLNNWECSQLAGLYNRPGRGRKKIFNEFQEKQIKAWVKSSPKDLSQVQTKCEGRWRKKVSKKTIKRIIKRAGMGWYRIRRKPGGQPLPSFYEKKIKELSSLKKQSEKGEIEIRYVDETGFCLTPYIPYAWQEPNQKIEIKSQSSQRLNVLGFLGIGQKLDLDSYTFKGSINSDVIVACIDDFADKITKKTILIMDNSSIHQNSLVWDKEQEWLEKGLEIFFLPTYSPQLNLIEILWRFMKYKWLSSDAYESFSTLVEAVENILKKVGTEYTINFV